MVRVWDFLMRRKSLMFGFLLIFIVSAAFSSVYLRPPANPGPVNVPNRALDDDGTEIVAPTPEPEPESVPDPTPDPTVHVAITIPNSDEVTELGEAIDIPRTNFGFTIPGNIVNFASLSRIAASRQTEQVDAVKTWHYIVSATTAALIFGGVMVCLARYLAKNML